MAPAVSDTFTSRRLPRDPAALAQQAETLSPRRKRAPRVEVVAAPPVCEAQPALPPSPGTHS